MKSQPCLLTFATAAGFFAAGFVAGLAGAVFFPAAAGLAGAVFFPAAAGLAGAGFFPGAGFGVAALPACAAWAIRLWNRSTGDGSLVKQKWCASAPEWYGRVTW